MSWQHLAVAAPDLVEYGEERLHDQVAYLATIKPDGAPPLHPVRPIVTGGHLFLFMEADSPKLHDLSRAGRYVLHCTATGDQPWDLREFAVEGTARRVVDLEMRNQANTGTGLPRDDHFVLLELQVTSALYKVYGSDGQPQRRRWRADPPD